MNSWIPCGLTVLILCYRHVKHQLGYHCHFEVMAPIYYFLKIGFLRINCKAFLSLSSYILKRIKWNGWRWFEYFCSSTGFEIWGYTCYSATPTCTILMVAPKGMLLSIYLGCSKDGSFFFFPSMPHENVGWATSDGNTFASGGEGKAVSVVQDTLWLY